MRLRDVLPGVPFDPRPLSRITPGTVLEPLTVTAPATLVQGVVFVPVPGRQGNAGGPGEPGPPGRSDAARSVDRITVTSAGELTVYLSHVPLPDTLEVYINGLRQFDLDDLPRAGTAVTFPDTWFLIPGERLALVYAY